MLTSLFSYRAVPSKLPFSSLSQAQPSTSRQQIKTPVMESTPFIPPEIIIMIMSTPNINLASLLRCTRVSKEWQSLVYSSNTLRAKLFLPQRSASGDSVLVTNPQYTSTAKIHVVLDTEPEDQKPLLSITSEAPYEQVAIHGLLVRQRVAGKSGSAFTLSYRILRNLHAFKETGRNVLANRVRNLVPSIQHRHLHTHNQRHRQRHNNNVSSKPIGRDHAGTKRRHLAERPDPDSGTGARRRQLRRCDSGGRG